MRTKGSSDELEHRRQLAVPRWREGYSAGEIAEFLGISTRSVWRWLASFRDRGPEGLTARPGSGRPGKLTVTPEKIVLRWRRGRPVEHGCATELWTAPRRAQLIDEEFAIRFHPRSLSAGRKDRGFPPEARTRPPPARPGGDRRGARLGLAPHQEEGEAPRGPPRPDRRERPADGPLGPSHRDAPRPEPSLPQAGGHRKTVSVAAALWRSRRRDRLGLSFHTLADGSFDTWYVTAFREAMLHDLPGRFVVVWDGGTMPKGEPSRVREAAFSDRLSGERFPPFPPLLNPVEPLWSGLKYARRNHFAPRAPPERDGRVIAELTAVRGDQAFLRNLFHASELPIPMTLLS